jgi:hypothetical protein
MERQCSKLSEDLLTREKSKENRAGYYSVRWLHYKKKEEKEYLRTEKSSLNSIDKKEVEEKLTVVVLRECYEK